MVGWHHQLNGHGFGWTLGVGDGQGGLACCGSWGHKELDTTERLNWIGLVGSPCCPRDSQESSPASQFKSINSSVISFLYSPSLHSYMMTGKTIALTRRNFAGRAMSLLFNMLSRLVKAFLQRNKHLLL